MIVVSDSSPLIALARVDSLDLLSELYPLVQIPTEVYNEVVIEGAGLPGALQVAGAAWIQVTPVRNTEKLRSAIGDTGFGRGEVAVVHLAQELGAQVVLMDERRARRYAEDAGLITFGCIGILEMLYRKGVVTDLRQLYERLLAQDFRIDAKTLEATLGKFGLKPI